MISIAERLIQMPRRQNAHLNLLSRLNNTWSKDANILFICKQICTVAWFESLRALSFCLSRHGILAKKVGFAHWYFLLGVVLCQHAVWSSLPKMPPDERATFEIKKVENISTSITCIPVSLPGWQVGNIAPFRFFQWPRRS